MLVREAIADGFTRDEAFEMASKRLKGTPAACKPDMMAKSYQKIERGLSPHAKAGRKRRAIACNILSLFN